MGAIERSSPLRIKDAYKSVVAARGVCKLRGAVSVLFGDTGHIADALSVGAYLESASRERNDLGALQASLGMQGVLLKKGGALDRAIVVFKEQELLCRRLQYPLALASSLGNQAVILRDKGELEAAALLHEEEERICRQSHDLAGLSASLCNQAIHCRTEDYDGALVLFLEQQRICRLLGDLVGCKEPRHQAMIWGNKGGLEKPSPCSKKRRQLSP